MIITLARKPLNGGGNVVNNCLQHGCGAINIDGCRIGTESTLRNSNAGTNGAGWGVQHINGSSQGRFPANVLLTERVSKLLDRISGISKSPANNLSYNRSQDNIGYTMPKGSNRFRQGAICTVTGHGDTGGASRFFKQIKETP